MAEERISILAYLKDQISPKVGKMVRGFRALGKVLKTASSAGTKSFGLLGRTLKSLRSQVFNLRNLVAGAAAGGIIKTFSDFERGMVNVYTLLDDAPKHAAKFEAGVKRLAKETGESLDDLATALFDAISAGVAPEGAIEFLEQSAKLAIAGNTDIAASTKGLVSVLNAYHIGTERAEEVSDSLFKAMKGGITTIERMSSVMGALAPTSSLVGVSFDEMNAAIAAVTKTGLSTEEAATAILNTFNVLLAPMEDAVNESERLSKLFPELNFELSIANLRAKGLAQFMSDLATVTGEEATVIKKLIPNIRAFKGVAVLASDGAKEIAAQMEQMAEKSGTTAREFAKVAETLDLKLKQLRSTFVILLVEIGRAAKPFIERTIERLREWIEYVTTRQNTIRVWVETILRSLRQLVVVAKELVKNLDVVPALVNSMITGITLLVRLFWASLPLLLSTVTLIGKQLGTALMVAIVGASKERIATELATGDIGLMRELLLKAGLGGEEVDRLKEIGNRLPVVREELKQLQRIADNPEHFARLGDLSHGDPQADAMFRRFAELAEMYTDRRRLFNAEVKKLQDEQTRLEGELSGQITDGLLDADKAAVRERSQKFIEDAGRIIGEELPNIAQGLAPGSRQAIDDLIKMWSDELSAKLRGAQGRDALRSVVDAVRKGIADIGAGVRPVPNLLYEALGLGAFAGSDGAKSAKPGVNIEQVVQRVTAEFEKLEKRMEAFRTKRDTARELGEGGFIFPAEAVEREQEAIAAMRGEIGRFDQLLESFFAKANSEEAAILQTELRQIIEQLGLVKREVAGADEVQGTFWTGMAAGIQNTLEDLADLRQLGVEVGTKFVTDVAGKIADAFVEMKGSWSEFVVSFLKGLSKMILQAAIAGAMIKALGPGGLNILPATGRLGGLLRRNAGGPIPGPRHVRSDVVPAVLAPGEFVIPRDAVDFYGSGAMEALRRRMVPRSALATLGSRPSARTLKRGFQTGGSVDAGGGMLRAVVVGSESEVERLVAGGRRAFLDFLAEEDASRYSRRGGMPA